MKKILLLCLALCLYNCSATDDTVQEETIIGRWNIVGFEGNVLYEFTTTKRYTFYSTDGIFPSLNDFLTDNPGHSGNDWWYENDKVVVDLNFGNTSTLTPRFKCNNNVIDWLDDNNQVHSTYFREDYSLTNCAD